MGYLEFSFTVPDETREALANRLMELGSTGLIEKPGHLVAYFDGSCDQQALAEGLASFPAVLTAAGLSPDFTFTRADLPDRDWNESWKESFVPIDVADMFTIIPSWMAHETGFIPIIVDPGMVFGTGHHETTRRCLRLIGELSASVGRGRFLDIGTGTGILAIAAGRMEFAQVDAVDVDPLAVDAAHRNVDANGLRNIRVSSGTIENTEGPYDLIAANLLSEILLDIAQPLSLRLAPPGRAILSGMLRGQEEGVVAAMERAGLEIEQNLLDGQWVTLVARKRAV
ncbi:MAG: hypothetical protein OHK006_23970 [Thermodesulfovibrionales bacterium]